jgi:hypothetical protein
MTTYNHAFVLAFSVPNCPDESGEETMMDVERIRAALLKRIDECCTADEYGHIGLPEAIGLPFDTYAEGEPTEFNS